MSQAAKPEKWDKMTVLISLEEVATRKELEKARAEVTRLEAKMMLHEAMREKRLYPPAMN